MGVAYRLEKISTLSYDTKPIAAGEEGREGEREGERILPCSRGSWTQGEEAPCRRLSTVKSKSA